MLSNLLNNMDERGISDLSSAVVGVRVVGCTPAVNGGILSSKKDSP